MSQYHQVESTSGSSSMHRIWAAFVLAVTLLLIAPLHAQQQAKQGAPGQEGMQQAYEKAHADYMQAQQRLKKIQLDTLQAHPELQEQEQSFNALLIEEMKSKGHTPEKDLAEIEKLQQQLQNNGVSESERQALMAKFQEKMIAFRKAQSQALQTQKVQQAQGELMGSMLGAMKEQDPQTEQLMQQITQKRQELEQMLKKASPGQ